MTKIEGFSRQTNNSFFFFLLLVPVSILLSLGNVEKANIIYSDFLLLVTTCRRLYVPKEFGAFPKKTFSNILSPVIYCDISKISNHTTRHSLDRDAWSEEGLLSSHLHRKTGWCLSLLNSVEFLQSHIKAARPHILQLPVPTKRQPLWETDIPIPKCKSLVAIHRFHAAFRQGLGFT